MSYLLGSEYCIQSLTNDVSDVQAAIKDVISKTGKINSVSWKFPDKFACDLNIDEYLNTYRYDSSDNENNQVAHIVLLELIIDRLGLMLQLHCEYIENSLLSQGKSKGSTEKSSKNNKTISPCLGLTSKKHWSKMTQLKLHVDSLQQEVAHQKKLNRDILTEMEAIQKANQPEEANLPANLSQQASEWLKSMEDERRGSTGTKKAATGQISKDISLKSCQTLETAFRPCEGCHISQTSLREAGIMVAKILAGEGQTSSLQRLSACISSTDFLVDNRLRQVGEALSLDIGKIIGLYREARRTAAVKAEEVVASCGREDRLAKELAKEKDKLDKERKSFLEERSDLQSQIAQHKKSAAASQAEVHAMTAQISGMYAQLQTEVADLSAKLVATEKDRFQFEKLKMAITDLQMLSGNPFECLSAIKKKLENQTEEIINLNLTLQNERVTNVNLSEVEHAAAEKENNLMKRLKQLSDQKHKLEDKIDVLGTKLDDANSKVKELQNQNSLITLEVEEKMRVIENLTKNKEEFTEKIKELQNQVCQLEDSVMEMENEKMLLMHYPDLDGALERIETGNVAEDIQMQIKANGARIRILSQQNVDLGNALQKLQASADQAKDSSLAAPFRCDSRMSSEVVVVNSDLKLNISRPASKMSSSFHSASKNRPQRNLQVGISESESIQSPVIQWSTTALKKTSPSMPCVCETCGRQYQQKSDMEIHKEYCAGRRRRNNHK